MLSASFEGMDEAIAAISKLGDFATHEVCLAALKKVGQPLAADMQAGCPKDTGLTADDIGVSETPESKAGGPAEVAVGAHEGKRGRAYIVRWIEYGTLRMPARPFVRPAWDGAKGSFVEDVVRELGVAYSRFVTKFSRAA